MFSCHRTVTHMHAALQAFHTHSVAEHTAPTHLACVHVAPRHKFATTTHISWQAKVTQTVEMHARTHTPTTGLEARSCRRGLSRRVSATGTSCQPAQAETNREDSAARTCRNAHVGHRASSHRFSAEGVPCQTKQGERESVQNQACHRREEGSWRG